MSSEDHRTGENRDPAQTAEPASAAHLDREILQTLQEVMEGQFPELINTFVNDSEERIRNLQKALATRDQETVRRQAHSFKGSCNNLGAVRLAELCQVMEDGGREGKLDGLEHELVNIQQEFSQLKSILNTLTE